MNYILYVLASEQLTLLTLLSPYGAEIWLRESFHEKSLSSLQCREKSGLNLGKDAVWVSDLAEEYCSPLTHVENRHEENPS